MRARGRNGPVRRTGAARTKRPRRVVGFEVGRIHGRLRGADRAIARQGKRGEIEHGGNRSGTADIVRAHSPVENGVGRQVDGRRMAGAGHRGVVDQGCRKRRLVVDLQHVARALHSSRPTESGPHRYHGRVVRRRDQRRSAGCGGIQVQAEAGALHDPARAGRTDNVDDRTAGCHTGGGDRHAAAAGRRDRVGSENDRRIRRVARCGQGDALGEALELVHRQLIGRTGRGADLRAITGRDEQEVGAGQEAVGIDIGTRSAVVRPEEMHLALAILNALVVVAVVAGSQRAIEDHHARRIRQADAGLRPGGAVVEGHAGVVVEEQIGRIELTAVIADRHLAGVVGICDNDGGFAA